MVFWFSISWKAHYKNLRAFKSIIAQKLLSYRQEICCQTKFKNLLDKCALDRVHKKSTLKWSHSIIQFSIGKNAVEKSSVWINKNILNLIIYLSKFSLHNAYCFRRGLIPNEGLIQHSCNMKGGMSFQHNQDNVRW